MKSIVKQATGDNGLIEAIMRLSAEQCREMLKAAKIINAVSKEQADQLIPLRKSGLTIEQIAERFGVEL